MVLPWRHSTIDFCEHRLPDGEQYPDCLKCGSRIVPPAFTQQPASYPPGLLPADIERFGADPVASFRGKLARVHETIAAACRTVGRDPSSVRLLPITKTVPAAVLRLAYEAGMTTFGE